MPKTKKYSFSDKKIILHSLNNGLINGYLKKEFIYKFDKIFNSISIDEFDLHIFLFKLWNQEKNLIKQYADNSNKLKQILEYIKQEILNKGYPPTVRDICDAVGLKSTSSVHSHLESLE